MTPTVVLLHALGSSRRMWRAECEVLGDQYELITLDLPGHGGNQVRFSMAAASEQVLDAIPADRGPVYLVGSSLGSSVALQVALNAPERVAGMVLSGTGLWVSPLMIAAQRVLTTVVPLRKLADISVKLVQPPESRDADNMREDLLLAGRRTQFDCLRAMRKERLDLFALRDLTIPALVCCGRDDQLNYASAATLENFLSNATSLLIDEGGHLWHIQYPGLFAKLIEGFIASNPVTTAV